MNQRCDPTSSHVKTMPLHLRRPRCRRFAVVVQLACYLLIAIAVSFPGDALAKDGERLVYRLTFTDYEEGSIDDWLMAKGFDFRQDAKRRNRIDFDVGDNGLVLEAKRRTFGIMLNEAVNAPEFTAIEIDWGIIAFPKGASYEEGVLNDALMVAVFMGDERQPSGSMFIPDSPYFIGLFLCKGNDQVNHPYIGRYFQKGGRYVCLGKPKEEELVTSRFDLLEAYRTFFDKERDDDPAISGLALSVDTKKSAKPGQAAGFIREIRLYR